MKRRVVHRRSKQRMGRLIMFNALRASFRLRHAGASPGIGDDGFEASAVAKRVETRVDLYRGELLTTQTMCDRIAEHGDGLFWFAPERELCFSARPQM
jgi:hypothetical protein